MNAETPVGHYRNFYIKETKALFEKEGVKKPKGRRIAISNGGYQTESLFYRVPEFGYRIYFDKKTNLINVQIISEVAEKLGHNRLREYSVCRENDILLERLDTIHNAILYKEYCDRVMLNKKTK
jgi:hypothetical protein